MSQILTKEGYELAHDLDRLDPDDMNNVVNLITLLKNGDVRIKEIFAMKNRGEINQQECGDLIDEYMAAKH